MGHLTPAEFRALAGAKIKQYEQKRGDLDAMNGMQCYVVAACAGNKDVTPENFMIFDRKRQPKKPQTEDDWNRALSAWTGRP